MIDANIRDTRSEIAVVNRKVDTTRLEVQAVNQRLSQVGLKSGDEVSRTRADLQVSIALLTGEMQKIQAQLEANQVRMTEIDRHLSQIKQQYAAQKSSPKDTSKSAGSYGANPLESELQTATDDFNRGRYDLAYRGFADVAAHDSSGTLAPQALFKMGECRFAQSNWDEARTLYGKLLHDYPKDSQRCASLFKLGLAHERQSGLAERDEAWARLQKSCPGSNEAQRAKEQQAATK